MDKIGIKPVSSIFSKPYTTTFISSKKSSGMSTIIYKHLEDYINLYPITDIKNISDGKKEIDEHK